MKNIIKYSLIVVIVLGIMVTIRSFISPKSLTGETYINIPIMSPFCLYIDSQGKKIDAIEAAKISINGGYLFTKCFKEPKGLIDSLSD